MGSMLCPPGRDGISEDLTADLPKPLGHLDRATSLHSLERLQQVRGFDRSNGPLADLREDIRLQPGLYPDAVAGAELVPRFSSRCPTPTASNVFTLASRATRCVAFFTEDGSASLASEARASSRRARAVASGIRDRHRVLR